MSATAEPTTCDFKVAHLDEKVARAHLDAVGVRLTELTSEQAAYIGVLVKGPYKLDHHRY